MIGGYAGKIAFVDITTGQIKTEVKDEGMARAIPNCCATFYANEGHFSIILNRIEEIWKIF